MAEVDTLPPCSKGPEHDWKDGDSGRFCRLCGLVWREPRYGQRHKLIGVPEAVTAASGSLMTPNPPSNPPSIMSRLLDRDGDRCTYCHRQFSDAVPPTKDHRITQRQLRDMTRRGIARPAVFDNLILACRPCNLLRGDMDELAFRVAIDDGTIELPWRDWVPQQ